MVDFFNAKKWQLKSWQEGDAYAITYITFDEADFCDIEVVSVMAMILVVF